LVENLLLIQKEGPICTLIINQPERRNILNPEILLSIGEILNALKKEDDTRAVIIRGAGEEAFSAGYDIGGLGNRENDRQRIGVDPMEYVMNCITSFPYPVIAMIYGYAIGGGLELAATCDLRFAAENACLGMTPARLGIVYRSGGILTFMNLIGVSATKELFYTGRLFAAQKAREMRLVDEIYPTSQLVKATYDTAREIADNAPLSIRGVKTTINRLLKYQKLGPEDDIELRKLQMQATSSEDFKEGQRAFLEKRKPKFTGK
jgi:enoyl-CoA hydratase